MKEKKYKDIKGFEDKNTFNLFDQFETQVLRGAKNRFIYDFSFPIYEDKTPQQVLSESIFTIRPWNENESPWAMDDLQYGNPGKQFYIITSKPGLEYFQNSVTYSRLLDLYSDHLWNEYENTVNQDEMTFYFNENSIGYLNYKPQTAGYGFIAKADYVDYFRAGYIEFSFKTNKQNCIIASGSKEIDSDDQGFLFAIYGDNFDLTGSKITSLTKGDTAGSPVPIQEKKPYYLAPSFDAALVNLNIEVKNGKICINYYDKYNRDDVSFNFIGNENVADNEWHHVVINFGRPGVIKEHGKKFNKKFVEIWIDGQLDKRFDDKVNEYQIFYPTVKWLFNSPLESANNVLDDFDIETFADEGFSIYDGTGFDSLFKNQDIFLRSVQHPKNIEKAFKGCIHLFSHGINIPLSQYEIKRRYRLWKKETKQKTFAFTATAEMKMPTISTNSKKALKLYWDDLIKNGKNGIELDDTFQIETYSVINKTKNSKTEIYNLDKSLTKNIEILENVRAAFTDNVIIYGPGMVWWPNLEEALFSGLGDAYKSPSQHNPKQNWVMDSVTPPGAGEYDVNPKESWYGPRIDLAMSGLTLNNGDRILLTGQIKTEDNGIWIFNGLDQLMTRPNNALLDDPNKTYVVYVSEGKYKDTYWQLNNTIETFITPQRWTLIDVLNLDELSAIPVHTTRWKDYRGEDRLINLEEDININNYDVIVFMNYPETNEELFQHFPNDPEALVIKQYNNFVKSIKNVVANGASVYVSSPRLAADLGIVKGFTEVPQLLQDSDSASASFSPFELTEPAERYFDTHRNNKYNVATTVPGLTNKETYILTDFINFTPETQYDFDQYHAKYSYRQFGLQEGNEFIIPGTALRKITENPNLPGYKENQRGTKPLMAVEPSNILAGTVITKLANNYYNGSTITANPYDDYATTIVVHNGQLLGDTPINGKIFVNCVEDGYTFSREEYNKAVIQVLPQTDVNETTATRAWQYSTTRLDRKPQRLNVSGLSSYGQTTPTNGGGGAFIQAPSNSSYGVIRSETDKGNVDYQSDLYPTEEEEIYPLQEIPVLSMTYLGLQWLAG
jgi:hypothetical protein